MWKNSKIEPYKIKREIEFTFRKNLFVQNYKIAEMKMEE